MMKLKEQKKAVEKRGERGREESPALVKDHAACDDRENVSDWEKTVFAACKINQDCDEQLVDGNLEERVPVEISDSFQQKSVNDRHKIKNADEVIESVGQRNKEISLLGNLKQKGDSEEKGKDDDATKH